MNIEHQPQMWLSEEVWIGVGWSLVSVGLQDPVFRCQTTVGDSPSNRIKKAISRHHLKKGQMLLDPGSGADMAVGDFPSTHDHSSPPLD